MTNSPLKGVTNHAPWSTLWRHNRVDGGGGGGGVIGKGNGQCNDTNKSNVRQKKSRGIENEAVPILWVLLDQSETSGNLKEWSTTNSHL